MRKTAGRKVTVFLIVIAVLSAAVLGVLCFFDGIAVAGIKAFTGYSVSFDSWKKDLSGRNQFELLKIWSDEKRVFLHADSVELFLDIGASVKARKVYLDMVMKGVELGFTGEAARSQDDSVYDLFFGTGKKYDIIKFFIEWDREDLYIKNIDAGSRDLKVSGDCAFLDNGKLAEMDIKFSLGPEIAGELGPDVRERVLFLDDDGWYSTIITYKGSAVLLQALYLFSSPEN